MAKLVWDRAGERTYETGTSKGVLFPQNKKGDYNEGVAWNGLISVKKSNDGAEETALYADNIKYLSMMSAENLKGSIDAYTYPTEFEACDGSAVVKKGVYVGQQSRTPFGLAWSTIVGNDTEGNTYGEKIHIIYNAKVSPSERAYETVNEDPTAITFSWDFNTTPVNLEDVDLEPSAGIVVSKTEVTAASWKSLQDLIYGTEAAEPSLPSLAEVIELMEPDAVVTYSLPQRPVEEDAPVVKK